MHERCFCLTPLSSFPSSLFKSIFEWEVGPTFTATYLWGAGGTLAGGLGLGFKGRDQTEQGTDTKSMALSNPLHSLSMRKKLNLYQEIIFVHQPLTRWPLFPFYLPSNTELQIIYSQAQVFNVFSSLTFASFLFFFRAMFPPFSPHSRDGLWHWRTQGTDVSGALHIGSILALKTARQRNWSEPKACLWVHEIPYSMYPTPRLLWLVNGLN